MQSARCYAANALHATSTLQSACGRATVSHTSRVGKSTINATRWPDSMRSRKCVQLRRSYTTSTGGTTKAGRGTFTSDKPSEKETRRAQRLAIYEDVLIKDDSTHLNEEQRQQQEREAVRSTHVHKESLVDWRTHSLAMSAQIREAKKAHSDPVPEDGEWVLPARQMSLDYTGLAIEPQTSNTLPPIPIPWAQSYEVREKEITAAQILDLEIAAFAGYMSPTRAERKARLHVMRSANTIITSVPGHQPYTFGSYKTRLMMPYSDIDIGMFDKSLGQHAMQPAMEHVYSTLQHGGEYMCVMYRPARHSIITAQHKATGIDIQIVARSSGFQDAQVQRYLEKLPHIKQLYGVVRTAFGVRGFVDPFIGGISAYGTFMMLAAALTRRGTPPDIHESPSSQLLHFLSFWAKFDTTKYGIALGAPIRPKDVVSELRPAKLFRKISFDDTLSPENQKSQVDALIRAARKRKQYLRAGQYRIGRTRPEQPYLLCLQDPSNVTNDLGATCHAIKHILQTIKVMHRDLARSMEEYDRLPPSKRPEGEMSFLLPLVGRSHELYAERRQRLHEWHRTGIDARRRANGRTRNEKARLAKGDGL